MHTLTLRHTVEAIAVPFARAFESEITIFHHFKLSVLVPPCLQPFTAAVVDVYLLTLPQLRNDQDSRGDGGEENERCLFARHVETTTTTTQQTATKC